MRKFKLFFSVLVGAIIGLSLSGFAYQLTMDKRDRVAYPAPGEIYQVDGLGLHIDCRGDGSPTVVLEAGLGSGSSTWALVHDEIAMITRTCAYDRPGMDWSEPIIRVADAEEVSDRLFSLLDVAGIKESKLLIGWSAGGIYIREFYKNHPEDIVGMVFVDSSHEQQENRLPEIEGSSTLEAKLQLIYEAIQMMACRILQPIGVIRMFGLLDQFIDQNELDAPTRNALLANMNQSHKCSSMHWESESFALEVQDDAPPISLGDLPVVVLSQGEEPKAFPEFGITLEQAIAQRKAWDVLQQELTDLSSNGQRYIATESGHVIQIDQPELMIEKVTELVLRLR